MSLALNKQTPDILWVEHMSNSSVKNKLSYPFAEIVLFSEFKYSQQDLLSATKTFCQARAAELFVMSAILVPLVNELIILSQAPSYELKLLELFLTTHPKSFQISICVLGCSNHRLIVV